MSDDHDRTAAWHLAQDEARHRGGGMALWQSVSPPAGFHEHWCQELHSLAELAKLRARLRATLTGSATVERPERDHWSERLVLIADELTSNALRHGDPP